MTPSGSFDAIAIDIDIDVDCDPLADGPRSAVRHRTLQARTRRHLSVARPFFACVPVVLKDAQALQDQGLDNRSGFVLSLVDGETTIEQVLDLSGMGTEETLALLEDLRIRGIIKF